MLDDLSGDIGDNRPVSFQFAGMFREAGESVQVNAELDTATGLVGVILSPEQVEVHVGAELVDGAQPG